jgi:hypothetical protein
VATEAWALRIVVAQASADDTRNASRKIPTAFIHAASLFSFRSAKVSPVTTSAASSPILATSPFFRNPRFYQTIFTCGINVFQRGEIEPLRGGFLWWLLAWLASVRWIPWIPPRNPPGQLRDRASL